MILFHGTKSKYVDIIIKEGFKIPEGAGRFGAGVYFAVEHDYAKQYSMDNIVLEVEVDMDNVLKINYLDLKNIYKDMDICWDEEEGIPELKDYVNKNNYDGVQVIYADDSSEIVMYEIKAIKNVLGYVNN